MTEIDEEGRELYELAWKKLPSQIRADAIALLKKNYNESFFEDVKSRITEHGLNNWLPEGWHFGQGMEIRNLFRTIVKDEDLPPLPEYYGLEISNWDDYYVQIIEAAAGCRE